MQANVLELSGGILTELLKQKQPEPQTIGMWTACPDSGHGRNSAWCLCVFVLLSSHVFWVSRGESAFCSFFPSRFVPMTTAEIIVSLWAGTRGYLDKVVGNMSIVSRKNAEF